MLLRVLISCWVGAIVLSAPGALATTITFDSSPDGLLLAPLVEGEFAISLHSGGIYNEPTLGSPPPEAEGSIAHGGGVISVTRNDLPGGLFTFDAASVAQFNMGVTDIEFEGYLGGVLQQTDTLTTGPNDFVHDLLPSVLLAGVQIDELRVVLDAGTSPFRWESVDNINVTPVLMQSVPEPSTVFLVAGGLLALRLPRRSFAS